MDFNESGEFDNGKAWEDHLPPMANLEAARAVADQAQRFTNSMLKHPSLKNINEHPNEAVAEVIRRVDMYKARLEEVLMASTTDDEYAEIAAAMNTIGAVIESTHEVIAAHIKKTLTDMGIRREIVAAMTEPLTNHARRFAKLEALFDQPRFWSTGAEDMNRTDEFPPLVERPAPDTTTEPGTTV